MSSDLTPMSSTPTPWPPTCSPISALRRNGCHALVGLLRQLVYGRPAGYEDVNDAERLRHDLATHWIVGGKAASGAVASPSQMGRFETRWLTGQRNLAELADLSGQWIDRVHARRPPRGVVLDMDSGVSPTHGDQEMSVWNGHSACTCYHPLFVFNQFGDLERCARRPGTAAVLAVCGTKSPCPGRVGVLAECALADLTLLEDAAINLTVIVKDGQVVKNAPA